MTTPAPQQQQQPPPQQPPPQQPPRLPPGSLPPAVVDAVAVALSALLLTALTAAAIIAALLSRFPAVRSARYRTFWQGLQRVLERIVVPHPPPLTGVIGAASEATARQNLARRAQFAVAAATRVAGAMAEARSRGEDVEAAADAQIGQETRYFQQHLDAMWNRARAAGMVDMAAAEHGNLLGWYAIRNDGKTTRECLAADHHNFYADQMPDIGWPGGGPHPNCRCFPGPPWPGAPLLAGSGPRRSRAA